MSESLSQENLISYDDFLSTSRRCHYNEFIADFYEKFASDNQMPIGLARDGSIIYGNDPGFMRMSKEVRFCCTNWTFDEYKQSGYKSLVRVNRCKNRFCLNCQELAAKQRMAQYTNVLDEFAIENDLYHVVLTVPNVDAEHLRDTVALMFMKFEYMTRFFDGRKKVRGVDFSKYGYKGAVRALEITTSKRDGSFHPHLHCIFVLKKGLDLPKIYWNTFSEDRTGRQLTRLFSELDMLFQRLWCLLIMKVKVTKDAIENIEKYCPATPNGFTCVADLTNGDYHEVFKYAIKGSFKNETLFQYEAFRTLYHALYKRRAYQAYGCLSRWDFESIDESLGLNEKEEAFERFITYLQRRELPKRVEEELTNILMNWKDGESRYISKATFLRHFKALSEEEKDEVLNKLMETSDVLE